MFEEHSETRLQRVGKVKEVEEGEMEGKGLGVNSGKTKVMRGRVNSVQSEDSRGFASMWCLQETSWSQFSCVQ